MGTRIAQEKKMQSPEKKSRDVIIPVINNVQEQSESLDSRSPCAVESKEYSIDAIETIVRDLKAKTHTITAAVIMIAVVVVGFVVAFSVWNMLNTQATLATTNKIATKNMRTTTMTITTTTTTTTNPTLRSNRELRAAIAQCL